MTLKYNKIINTNHIIVKKKLIKFFPDVPRACNICKEKFANSNLLKLHMVNHNEQNNEELEESSKQTNLDVIIESNEN